MKLNSNDLLHLTYCTNIHPGHGWDEVLAHLRNYAPALKQRLAPEQPFGLGLTEFHNEFHHGERLMRHPADAKPTHLDQTGEGLGRTHQQPPVPCLDIGAVVGHEPGKWDEALRGGVQQCQREAGLARP